jgi:hypothetical protein
MEFIGGLNTTYYQDRVEVTEIPKDEVNVTYYLIGNGTY